MEEIILPSLIGILLALTIILIYLLIESSVRINIKEIFSSFSEKDVEKAIIPPDIKIDEIIGKFLISKEEIPMKTAESLITFGFLNFNQKHNYFIINTDEDSIKRIKRALKIISYQNELLKREEHVWIEPKNLLLIGIRNIVVLEVENIIKVEFFVFPTTFVIELFRNKDLRKRLLIISEHSKRIVLENGVLIAMKKFIIESTTEGRKVEKTYMILAEVINDSDAIDSFLDNLANSLKNKEKIDKESFIKTIKKVL